MDVKDSKVFTDEREVGGIEARELLPCPFCGGSRAEVFNALEEQPEMELVGLTKDNWNVVCCDCYGSGGTRRTAVDAIEAWNRRT